MIPVTSVRSSVAPTWEGGAPTSVQQLTPWRRNSTGGGAGITGTSANAGLAAMSAARDRWLGNGTPGVQNLSDAPPMVQNYVNQRQSGGGGGGGMSGHMDSHMNQKQQFNPITRQMEWQPVTVNATPDPDGANAAPNANPNMGSTDAWHALNPDAAGLGETGAGPHSWQTGAQPDQTTFNHQIGLPGFEKGGTIPANTPALVGDDAGNSNAKPEVAVSSAPITVVPNDQLPPELVRNPGGVLELKPDSPYVVPGSQNFSTGGDVYAKPAMPAQPPATGVAPDDAPPLVHQILSRRQTQQMPPGGGAPVASATDSPPPPEMVTQMIRDKGFGVQSHIPDSYGPAKASNAAGEAAAASGLSESEGRKMANDASVAAGGTRSLVENGASTGAQVTDQSGNAVPPMVAARFQTPSSPAPSVSSTTTPAGSGDVPDFVMDYLARKDAGSTSAPPASFGFGSTPTLGPVDLGPNLTLDDLAPYMKGPSTAPIAAAAAAANGAAKPAAGKQAPNAAGPGAPGAKKNWQDDTSALQPFRDANNPLRDKLITQRLMRTPAGVMWLHEQEMNRQAAQNQRDYEMAKFGLQQQETTRQHDALQTHWQNTEAERGRHNAANETIRTTDAAQKQQQKQQDQQRKDDAAHTGQLGRLMGLNSTGVVPNEHMTALAKLPTDALKGMLDSYEKHVIPPATTTKGPGGVDIFQGEHMQLRGGEPNVRYTPLINPLGGKVQRFNHTTGEIDDAPIKGAPATGGDAPASGNSPLTQQLKTATAQTKGS